MQHYRSIQYITGPWIHLGNIHYVFLQTIQYYPISSYNVRPFSHHICIYFVYIYIHITEFLSLFLFRWYIVSRLTIFLSDTPYFISYSFITRAPGHIFPLSAFLKTLGMCFACEYDFPFTLAHVRYGICYFLVGNSTKYQNLNRSGYMTSQCRKRWNIHAYSQVSS